MTLPDLAHAASPGSDMLAMAMDMSQVGPLQSPDLSPAPAPDMTHAAGTIPDPGNGNPNGTFPWPDTEPNNTPDKAVAVGTATVTETIIRPWFDSGPDAIGGTDTADYWVFRSSPSGGTFSFDMSWSSNTNLADAALYKVVAGVQQMPAVKIWDSTSTSGESATMGVNEATLEASTVYLFEITAVDAPVSTGYSA
jgi:hypothetical protein